MSQLWNISLKADRSRLVSDQLTLGQSRVTYLRKWNYLTFSKLNRIFLTETFLAGDLSVLFLAGFIFLNNPISSYLNLKVREQN